MARAHRRGADLERRAAKALGTERVHRSRYEVAPDLREVRTSTGVRLQPECKHRKALPALITKGLQQARRYAPDAHPLLILQAHGSQPVVCMSLAVFAQVAGFAESIDAAQGVLALVPTSTTVHAVEERETDSP